MTSTVADYILSRLREWGVRHVFGYPGDGINGLKARSAAPTTTPELIQARHEEMATSGPGAIHLLNDLYDAKLDHI